MFNNYSSKYLTPICQKTFPTFSAAQWWLLFGRTWRIFWEIPHRKFYFTQYFQGRYIVRTLLTWALCNRHPFSNNGIFTNFIEQITKKMRFWSKIKRKKNFGGHGPAFMDSKVGKIQKSVILNLLKLHPNIVNMVFFPNNSRF